MMDNKNSEKKSFDSTFERFVKDEPKNEIEKPIVAVKAKRQLKVQLIMGNKFLLVDNNGKGFVYPMTEEHKNAKIGDIVSI
jgi:hypothetical protein